MSPGFLRLFSFFGWFHTKVRERDLKSLCEKCHFSQALFERAVIKDGGLLKHERIRHKGYLGPGVRNIAGSQLFKRHCCLTSRKSLVINDPALFDLDIKPLGERVDDRSSDAVKSSGNLISAAAEFTACMELGKYKVDRVSSCLVVDADGDASSVIFYRDAPVLIDRHLDMCTVTCQRLIHRVVHDLIDQMVKTSGRSSSDVHARSLADGLESLKHLDIICCICSDLGSVFQIVVKFVSVH